MIHCTHCKELKPREAFLADRSKRNGLRSECRVCFNAYKRRWYADNRERSAGYCRKLKYGTDGLALLEEQDGKCAICATDLQKETTHRHIDHCHETKQVRGWLCRMCNLGLGRFKDDPVRLRAAADYLEKE